MPSEPRNSWDTSPEPFPGYSCSAEPHLRLNSWLVNITEDNLDKSIEEAGQKTLRAPPSSPPMAVPPRLNREILIRGAPINSTVSGRSPEEIVKAVNSAIKAEIFVAALWSPLGNRRPRPNAEETSWVQTALGLDAAVNRRVFSVIANGFPVRLSQNQDQEDMQK
ncbi:hypothetical protein E4U61_003466 [Claviceps capensis]|nr:hypothetical protein E4U61_003466 [Claviceps capensis]